MMYKQVRVNSEKVRIGKDQEASHVDNGKVVVFFVTKQVDQVKDKKKIKFIPQHHQIFDFITTPQWWRQLANFEELFNKFKNTCNDNYFIIFVARGKWFTTETLQKEKGGMFLEEFIRFMNNLFNYNLYQNVNKEDQSVAFIYDNNEKKCYESIESNGLMKLEYIWYPDEIICDHYEAKVHKNVGWDENKVFEKKECCFIQCGSNAQLSNGNKKIKRVGASSWNCGALGDLNCHHYKIKIINLPSGSGGLMIGFAQKSKFNVNGSNCSSGYGWYLCDNGVKYNSSTNSVCSIGNINYTSETIIEVKYDSKKEIISYIINGQNYENVFTNVNDTYDICPAFDICYLNIEFEFMDL